MISRDRPGPAGSAGSLTMGGLERILAFMHASPPLALAAASPVARLSAERSRTGLQLPYASLYHLPSGDRMSLSVDMTVAVNSHATVSTPPHARSTSSPIPAAPPSPRAEHGDFWNAPAAGGAADDGARPRGVSLCDLVDAVSGWTRWVACSNLQEGLLPIKWWLLRPIPVAAGADGCVRNEPMSLALSLRGVAERQIRVDADLLPVLSVFTLNQGRLSQLDFTAGGAHSALTHLHLCDCPYITDLRFLAALPRLRSICLTRLAITSVAEMLTHCEVLEAVGLHYCDGLRDISPLAELHHLLELDLNGLPVRALPPASPTEDGTEEKGRGSLRVARIIRCRALSDLRPLTAHQSHLRSLLIAEAAADDLDWLAECLHLEELMLEQLTGVPSLAVLARLPRLRDLHVEEPGDAVAIADFLDEGGQLPHTLRSLRLRRLHSRQAWDRIGVLSSLTALSILEASRLTDAAFLARLTGLVDLELSFAGITDIAPVAALPSLQTVRLSQLRIHSIRPLTEGASAGTIRELALDNCDRIPPDAGGAGAPHQEWVSLANLVSLRLFSAARTRINSLAWTRRCPQLLRLRLRDCPELTSAEMTYVARGVAIYTAF